MQRRLVDRNMVIPSLFRYLRNYRKLHRDVIPISPIIKKIHPNYIFVHPAVWVVFLIQRSHFYTTPEWAAMSDAFRWCQWNWKNKLAKLAQFCSLVILIFRYLIGILIGLWKQKVIAYGYQFNQSYDHELRASVWTEAVEKPPWCY